MKKTLFFLIASLLLCGAVNAQNPEPHWTAATGLENMMPFLGVVQLDGEFIGYEDYANIEIAAFIGDECRMSTFLVSYEGPEDPYPYIMKSIGNTAEELAAQATVTFKMYNHTTEKEYSICTYTCQVNGDGLGYWWPDSEIVTFFSPITKEIAAWSTVNEVPYGFYLLSSPIGAVDPTAVTNMVDGNFDLYYFDQTQVKEWVNYKNGTTFGLEIGKGYLYANESAVTLEFNNVAYTGSGEVTLVKDETASLAGWNLVGNPFNADATINRSFYAMNADGSDLIAKTETDAIAPMEGVFVVANTDGETMTFVPAGGKASSNRVVVDLSKERGNVMDRVIVRFGNGDVLPKFQINEQNTKIYMPQNEENYAILNASNEGQMPVNFEPAEDGTYTLVVTPENIDMQYLHLIDNLTGDDVDLLTNPKYIFNASTTDYASRFILRFRTNNSVDVNEMFCPISYRQDGTLAINGIQGESKLQLVDMLGHVISTESINGDIVRHINIVPGVYVVRLINNNNIYTQKIVVE